MGREKKKKGSDGSGSVASNDGSWSRRVVVGPSPNAVELSADGTLWSITIFGRLVSERANRKKRKRMEWILPAVHQ